MTYVYSQNLIRDRLRSEFQFVETFWCDKSLSLDKSKKLIAGLQMQGKLETLYELSRTFQLDDVCDDIEELAGQIEQDSGVDSTIIDNNSTES